MKKNKYGLMRLIVGAALLAWLAPIGSQAASYRPLPEQTKAAIGATHVATVTYADLTETNSATAQAITVATIPAYHAVEGVIAVLKTAFYGDSTNISSTVITVGTATSASIYLGDMEVNSNGTEEWLKWGTGTNEVYTNETDLVITFTPTGIDGMSELTAGEILFYLKDIDQPTFAH
jgi:hypothetical protein